MFNKCTRVSWILSFALGGFWWFLIYIPYNSLHGGRTFLFLHFDFFLKSLAI